MKNRTLVYFTACSVLLCACTQPGVDVEAERAALRAAAEAYHAASEAMDVDGFVSFYADDGLLMPPNTVTENSLEGVRSFISGFTEFPDAEINFADLIVEVAASGDMGYTLAEAVVSFEGPDGAPVEDKVRDFHLWKKRDGEWKLAVDIWNSELPLPGVAATSVSPPTSSEDAVIADPDHYAVEFENDRVRIIRINYGPGEKSVMHSHGPHAAVFLTSNDVRMTLPDGTSEELAVEAGNTQWLDWDEHLPENLSDEPVEVVLVELKD